MFGHSSLSTHTDKSGDAWVQLQQGQPITDADWNENAALLSQQVSKLAEALFGWHGTTDAGFALMLASRDLTIGKGSYFVNGRRAVCEIDDPVKMREQVRDGLLYLEVWNDARYDNSSVFNREGLTMKTRWALHQATTPASLPTNEAELRRAINPHDFDGAPTLKIVSSIHEQSQPIPIVVEVIAQEATAAHVVVTRLDRPPEVAVCEESEVSASGTMMKMDPKEVASWRRTFGASEDTHVAAFNLAGDMVKVGESIGPDGDGQILISDLKDSSGENLPLTPVAGSGVDKNITHIRRVCYCGFPLENSDTSQNKLPYGIEFSFSNWKGLARGDRWFLHVGLPSNDIHDHSNRRSLAPLATIIDKQIKTDHRRRLFALPPALPAGSTVTDGPPGPLDVSSFPLPAGNVVTHSPRSPQTSAAATIHNELLSDAGISALKQYLDTPREILRRIPARYLKTAVSYAPLTNWLAPALISDIVNLSFEDFADEFQQVVNISQDDWPVFEQEARDVLRKAKQFSQMMTTNAGMQSLLS